MSAVPSELSATSLDDRLNEHPDSTTIVDIRRTEEYALGHIPTAVNIPLGDFPEALDQHSWTGDVIVVCPVGTAARQAAQLVACYEQIDADRVYYLDGGYAAWSSDVATEFRSQ